MIETIVQDLPTLDDAPSWTDLGELTGDPPSLVPEGIPAPPTPQLPDLDAILNDMFGGEGPPIDLAALTDELLESLPIPPMSNRSVAGALDDLIGDGPRSLIELPAIPELGDLLAWTPFDGDDSEDELAIPELDDVVPEFGALPALPLDLLGDEETPEPAGSMLGSLGDLPGLAGLPMAPALGSLLGDTDDNGLGLDLGGFGWG